MKYFVYSDDCGVSFVDSEQEAISWCNDEIQHYREQAGLDEWPVEVESICYGKVIAKTSEYPLNEGHSDYFLDEL